MQPSSAGHRARTNTQFHSPLGIPRIFSRLASSRVADSLSFFFSGWPNSDRMRSPAAATAFGSALASAWTAAAPDATSRSWGRRLNSSGQVRRRSGSVLTHETCNSPNSFSLAARATGTVPSPSSTLATVSRAGSGWKSRSFQSTTSPALALPWRVDEWAWNLTGRLIRSSSGRSAISNVCSGAAPRGSTQTSDGAALPSPPRRFPVRLQEHGTGGAGLDPFGPLVEDLAEPGGTSGDGEVGLGVVENRRRIALLPFADLALEALAQAFGIEGAAVEQYRVDAGAVAEEIGEVAGDGAVGGERQPPFLQPGPCLVRPRIGVAFGEEAVEQHRLDLGARQLRRQRAGDQPGAASRDRQREHLVR